MKPDFFTALGNIVVAKDLDQVVSSFFINDWIILLFQNCKKCNVKVLLTCF